MVIVIIYDWYFFDYVVEWIVEVDCGCLIGYEGNYLIYLEKKVECFDI